MKRKERRTQRTKRKKRQSIRPARLKRVAPRTAEEFFARSRTFQDRWTRATHVITEMRVSGISLRQAAHEFELDPKLVLRLVGPALRKRATGRYATKASDRLLRVIVIPTSDGLAEIATRDSREASKVAKYWNAIHRYLAIGDAFALGQFKGKKITDAKGTEIRLLTNLEELDRIGSAGNLSFESIYPK